MKAGLFVGSFDPFTNGHFEIVQKALNVFDKVIIGIGENQKKQRMFEKEIMQIAIQNLFAKEIKLGKVEVVVYNTLTAELAKQKNVSFIIRGLRNSNDYNYEEDIANINDTLFGIDTIYFRAKHSYISSTLIRDLVYRNKDISKLVPTEIFKVINNPIK